MKAWALSAGGSLATLLLAGPVGAQATGAITGTVREAGPGGQPLSGARVSANEGRTVVLTDALGTFRIRELAPGWHRVMAAAIGYRPLTRDSVLVRAGQTTPLDLVLQGDPVGLQPIEVIAARVDSVLDPMAVQDQQRFTAEELRRLPVTSVEEALALSAGAVGESYRGGRLGQQAFILDGLGLKNQLDASSGSLGLRLPPDLLAEASLITNGFSARYGQAVSALVNLSTRDGGDRWGGRVAYETDRPLWDGNDYGADRAVLSADGPLPLGIRVVAVADLSGRLDAEPVNAPRPGNSRDPRHEAPWLLPHNSSEQADLATKLTIPLGRQTLRLLGLHSAEQRLLFDPVYKYEPDLAAARRVTSNHLSAHLQRSFTATGVTMDARLGYFDREFLRGTPGEPADYALGAFTGRRLSILGEELARRQDTTQARGPIPGYVPPTPTTRSPWGVPAFFMGGGGRGDLSWNRFREWRGRVDVSLPAGSRSDVSLGAEYSGQRVRTFQRVLGYLPVGDSVPAASAADFTPWTAAAYAEVQARLTDLALTIGFRYDQFSGRDDLPGQPARTQRAISPRLALSTVLKGATLVASYGRFRQAPDYQFLVDAAFDDTTRTGRFRQGNPSLGFESATQYEFSLRLRPRPETSLRINVFVRRLDQMVGSVPFGVDPDSSIFGNTDAGSVKGGEILLEREFRRGWGARLSYTLQEATAYSTSAFFLRQAPRIDPNTGDTVYPARVEFPLDFDRRHAFTGIVTGTVPGQFGPALLGARVLGGLEGTGIFRLASGLPYSRTNQAGDSIVGLPNGERLPLVSTLDLLLRRPLRLGRYLGSVYLDVRNVLGRRNILSVRRDTGSPRANPARIQALADSAYAAHPDPIPYESSRYRRWADLDQNGLLEGAAELRPLYLAAARDYAQPLFSYGAPRLIRLGAEFVF